MDLIQHPCNTGFQYFENMFLNITAASTATVTVDVYAVRWNILQLTQSFIYRPCPKPTASPRTEDLGPPTSTSLSTAISALC